MARIDAEGQHVDDDGQYSFWHPTPRKRPFWPFWGILAAIALLLTLWAVM